VRALLAKPSLEASFRIDAQGLLDFLDRAARHVPRESSRDAGQLPAGTARIKGLLTLFDCRDGVTLSMAVDGRQVKLHNDAPNEIRFTSFNSSVTETIGCGPAPEGGLPAVVVYRPGQSDSSIGEPVAVDFLQSLSDR
jgi:hypothetical protein